MIEILGWLGSFCFAICGMPQAWASFKVGHAKGVSAVFLCLWLGGEIFTMLYTIFKLDNDLPILSNLICNSVFILVIMRYKFFPRRDA